MSKLKPLVGTWIQSGSPAVVEVLDGAFDFLCIDQEHTPVGIETVTNMIRAARKSLVFVRIPNPDYHETRRYADIGANGIIAAMVQTKEDANAVASGCRYPPYGFRGLGFCRANQYGKHLRTQEIPLAIAQIETSRGYMNREEIARTAIDGVLIGPYDLAQSFGIDYLGKAHKRKMREIRETCSTIGIRVGMHIVETDPKTLDAELSLGCDLLAYGTDLEFIRNESRRHNAR